MSISIIRKTVREILKEESNIKIQEAAGDYCPRIGKEVKSAGDVYENLKKSGMIDSDDYLVLVDGNVQEITVIRSSSKIKKMKCSTAASGFGNTRTGAASGPTSTGLLKISDIIGEGEPIGTVFEKRVKTGKIVKPNTGREAYMTTRLIILEGLQNENENIRSRGIYIHGTNKESKLGTKASHGCIRVSNADVIWIADNIPIGSYVYVWGDPIDTNISFPCSETSRTKEMLGASKDAAFDYVRKKYQDIVDYITPGEED